MSVLEQSAAAKQNAIGSEPPRPALALNVTMLLCGSLAAAGSIALLVLAILRTLAAANTVSVHWADRTGETPRSTSAGAASGPLDLAPLTPEPDPHAALLMAAAQRRAGQWDRPELDALTAGLAVQGTADAGAEIPRSRRWQIYFPEGLTIIDYAMQLDTFGIELGMLSGGGQIEYATALSLAAPTRRQGAVAAENRLYLSWTRGDLMAADRDLLAKAALDTKDKIVVQFYPDATEQQLAALEQSHMGRPAKSIYRTVFGIRPKLSTYEFYVREQIARE